MDIDYKHTGLDFAVGAIVAIGMPIVGGFLSGLSFLQGTILQVTWASIIAAGLIAAAASFVIGKYVR